MIIDDHHQKGLFVIKPSFIILSCRGIWTEVMPLGWYVVDILRDTHGTNWPAAKCAEWAGTASTAVPELPCPCNVQQVWKKAPYGLCRYHTKRRMGAWPMTLTFEIFFLFRKKKLIFNFN